MTTEADVIIVGAGPAGSAAAHYMAKEGLRVIALEKAHFPRDKVCGDGLTPRAVRELELMGVPTPESEGWVRNKGLRIIGGGHRLEFPWIESASFPGYGLTLPRARFDHVLALHARATGADVREGVAVERVVRDERTGKTVGVTARRTDPTGRKVGPVVTYRAPLVVAADGVSSRIATGEGIARKKGRPMGVGVRTYFRVDRPRDEWMEGHLELWAGQAGKSALLPGYGWIFSVDDGLVNVGLGTLSARGKPSGLDHRAMLEEFIKNTAGDWGFDEEARAGETLGAAIPMAFSRQPHYRDGLMLVGDSGGMVNPFNGEGIAYAMQAARRATEAVVEAREQTRDRDRERALGGYARQMKADLGGYYGMGRVFAALIERPAVMRACTRYGLPRRRVMWITHKLLSDVYEPHGGDWADRILATLARVAPKA